MQRLFVIVLFLVACGGRRSTGDSHAQGADAGAVADGGSFAIAAHPGLPRVVTQQGAILTAPKLVPVFFTNDDGQTPAAVVAFLNALVAANYWRATVSEYGVGAATVEPAVTAGAATRIDDAQLGDWLTARIDDHTLPTPDANTLYLLHYPSGVRVTEGGGTACRDWDAYHSDFRLAGQNVAYAVIPRCASGTSGVDGVMNVLTTSESHEIVEAVTDPYPDYDPAFAQADDPHLFWDDVNSGSEIADMCQYDTQTYSTFPDLDFMVQRSWSNAAAAAGHEPCVPPLADKIYFNAIPELTESISYSYSNQTVTASGIHIPIGQSKTITLDLYSDAPIEPWTVLAQDYGAWSCTMGAVDPQCDTTMDFAWSTTTGTNGDRIQLTITPRAAGSTGADGNYDYFVVTSTNAAGEQHFSVGLVAE